MYNIRLIKVDIMQLNNKTHTISRNICTIVTESWILFD